MGYSSKEVLRLLHDDGWYEVGKATVIHPTKDLKKTTYFSMVKQAGLK
jgi:predicted RNA binding protein YcfA (HicA-like mRNA interferase family)